MPCSARPIVHIGCAAAEDVGHEYRIVGVEPGAVGAAEKLIHRQIVVAGEPLEHKTAGRHRGQIKFAFRVGVGENEYFTEQPFADTRRAAPQKLSGGTESERQCVVIHSAAERRGGKVAGADRHQSSGRKSGGRRRLGSYRPQIVEDVKISGNFLMSNPMSVNSPASHFPVVRSMASTPEASEASVTKLPVRKCATMSLL